MKVGKASEILERIYANFLEIVYFCFLIDNSSFLVKWFSILRGFCLFN